MKNTIQKGNKKKKHLKHIAQGHANVKSSTSMQESRSAGVQNVTEVKVLTASEHINGTLNERSKEPSSPPNRRPEDSSWSGWS